MTLVQCRISLCGLLAFLLATALLAQQETGSMIGAVMDPSGSAVPGAQVTVRNTATSVSSA